MVADTKDKDKRSDQRADILPLTAFLMMCIVVFYLIWPQAAVLWRYRLFPLEKSGVTKKENIPQKKQVVYKVPDIPKVLTQNQLNLPTQIPPAEKGIVDKIIAGVNSERKKVGLKAYKTDPILSQIATFHSEDMDKRNYHDHISPEGLNPFQRVGKFHRRLFGLSGENIQFIENKPTSVEKIAEEFVVGWMNSPGHRRNILSDDFTHSGAGCASQLKNGIEKRYCTQVFSVITAYSENDIPATAVVGEKFRIELRPLEPYSTPVKLLQTDIKTDKVLSSTSLTEIRGHGIGDLTVKGAPGQLTELKIHVTVPGEPNKFMIIPGPYVLVQ